jgi:hypothetical protein
METPHSVCFSFNPHSTTFDTLKKIVESVTLVAGFKLVCLESHSPPWFDSLEYKLESYNTHAQSEFDADLSALEQIEKETPRLRILICPLGSRLAIGINFPRNLNRYPSIKDQVETLILTMLVALDAYTRHVDNDVFVYIEENRGEAMIPVGYENSQKELMRLFKM